MQNSPAFIKQERPVTVEPNAYTTPPRDISDSKANFDESCVKNANALSKSELHHKLNIDPSQFTFLAPSHTKSAVWSKHDFRFIVYNDVRQKFVMCMTCRSILSYTGRTGTASLLRHKCEKGVRTSKEQRLRPPKMIKTDVSPNQIYHTNQLIEMETDEVDGLAATDNYEGAENETLTAKDVLNLIASADADVQFRTPLPESDFTIVYYKDIRQNYASCNQCKNIVFFSQKSVTPVSLNHNCGGNLLSDFDSKIDEIEGDEEEFSVEKLFQDMYSVDAGTLHVTAGGNLARTGPGQVVQRIVQWISQSCKSFETVNDANFEKFVQCLLGLGARDRATVGKHFSEIVTNIRYVLFPELETKLQGHLSDHVNEKRTSKFDNTCFACDLWPKRSLLWAAYVTQDFYFRKMFVGSVAEKAYNTDFLRKLLTACGLEVSQQTFIVANDECAAFLTVAEACILDNIRQIFVDFFNSVKTDEQFMQSLLCFYNLNASQRNDPTEDAAVEISLDLDFTIALAKSYPMLANEVPVEDGKPSLDTFFELVQPFIDCIESLTAETNPTINEVHLWKKKLENVFDRPPAGDKVAKQVADVFGALIKTSFLSSDAQKVAVFFDPNFKSLKFLNETEKQEVFSIVRSRFEHLKPAVPQVKKEAKQLPSTSSVVAKKFAEFADVDDDGSEPPTDIIDYEIRRYVDFRLDGPVDMLEFWRETTGFPNLKQLCREILAIPACSQQNLMKYSSGARAIKEQCMRLKAEEFNTILAMHYGMKP